jgi:hypothetical protein
MIRLFDPEAPADPPRLPDGAPAAPRGDPSDQSGQSRSRLDFTRRRRVYGRLALGFALVGLILSALYLYMVSYGSIGPVSIGTVSIGTVSMYTAQSLVYIQPPPHWPNNDDSAAYDSYVQQQMLNMTRPDVLAGALKMLAPGVWQQSGESDDSAADRLHRAVEVARVGTGYLVAITAHANHPDTAAALANAVAVSYIEKSGLEQKAVDAVRLTVLKEEQERIGTELDDDRAEQAKLNAQLVQMTRSTAGATPKLQRSSDLANDITRLQDLYNTVDEQLQNQTLEESAPGTAHLAEAAIPPSYFAIAEVVRNALLLLFAFILLGLAVAVVAHKMERRAVAQNPSIVPEEAPAGPAREIPALAETAAAATVMATPPAPTRQVTQESVAPEQAGPERVAPMPATVAPEPLPQSAPVVAEDREAQSLPQRAPVAPAIPRNIAPESLWLVESASQSALKPPMPIMPRPTVEDPRSQPAQRVETPPAQQLRDEALAWLQDEPPWWFTDAPAPTDSALTQPRKPLLGAWHSIPPHDRQKPAVAQVREKEKAADAMPTRLSGLRSLHFSLEFKELSQKKDAGRGDSGNRWFVGGVRAGAALVDPEQTMVAEAIAPPPEREPVKAKEEETVARTATSRWMTAEPEFLSRSRGRDQ